MTPTGNPSTGGSASGVQPKTEMGMGNGMVVTTGPARPGVQGSFVTWSTVVV